MPVPEEEVEEAASSAAVSASATTENPKHHRYENRMLDTNTNEDGGDDDDDEDMVASSPVSIHPVIFLDVTGQFNSLGIPVRCEATMTWDAVQTHGPSLALALAAFSTTADDVNFTPKAWLLGRYVWPRARVAAGVVAPPGEFDGDSATAHNLSLVRLESPIVAGFRNDAWRRWSYHFARCLLGADSKYTPDSKRHRAVMLRWFWTQRSFHPPAHEDDPILPSTIALRHDHGDELRSYIERETGALATHAAAAVCRDFFDTCDAQTEWMAKLRCRTQPSSPIVRFRCRPTSDAQQMTVCLLKAAGVDGTDGTYVDEECRIDRALFEKLQAAYERTTGIALNDKSGSSSASSTSSSNKSILHRHTFWQRVWEMVTRYHMFDEAIDKDDTDGHCIYEVSPQPKLPAAAFAMLVQQWGIHHECFSSPLRAQLASYGTCFPDTDRWFGAGPNFMQLSLANGSFLVHPIYIDHVLNTAALRILAALEYAQRQDQVPKLSFVAIWPAWTSSASLQLLAASRFVRAILVLGKNGQQTATHRTVLLWLQTDPATIAWPCTRDNFQTLASTLT